MKDSIPKHILIPHNTHCRYSRRDCGEGVVRRRNVSTVGEEIIGHETQDSLLQTPRKTGRNTLLEFVKTKKSGAGCGMLYENSSLGTLTSYDSTTTRMLWFEDNSEEGLADDSHDFERSVRSVSESMSEEGSVEEGDSHDFGRPVYSVSESMSCSSLDISVRQEPRDDTYCKHMDSIDCTGPLPHFQQL